MKYQDLERFEGLGQDAEEEARWEALKALEPCLDDLFIEEDSVDFGLGIPIRLTTFRGADGTQAYVTVTDAGYVILGRVDRLADQQRRLLGDFEPRFDEVLSIAVSQAQRYTADTCDLWVSVIRHPRSEEDSSGGVHLYHGIVAATADSLVLRPPRDDRAEQTSDLWSPHPVSNTVPDWLKRWNVSTHPEDAANLPGNMALWLPKAKYAAIDAIAWSEGWLSYAKGRSLYFLHDKQEKTSLELPERAYCLSLRKAHDGWIYGLVGCGDRRVIFFRLNPLVDLPKIEILDEREYRDYPTAVHILPGATEKNPIYDILVIERGGWLVRQRYLGFVRLKRLWLRLWKTFHPRDPSALFQDMQKWIDEDATRADCVARYALQACLSRDATITPEQRKQWLDEWIPPHSNPAKPSLFKSFRKYPHFPRRFLDELIRSLLAYAQGKTPGLFLSEGLERGDFRSALMYRIYLEELYSADRQWTGLQLMPLNSANVVNDDHWVVLLREGLQEGALNFGSSPFDAEPLARLNHSLGQWSEEFTLKVLMNPKYRSSNVRWSSLTGIHGRERSGGLRPLLALSYERAVDCYSCTVDNPRPISVFALDHDIESITALPPEVSGGFAIIENIGEGQYRLRILSVEWTPKDWRVREVCSLNIPELGFSSLICACPGPNQAALLTVLVNQGRSAKILNYRLNANWEIAEMSSPQQLLLPWVKDVDMAFDGYSGLWLFVSTEQSSISRLYFREGNGCWEEKREFDSLKRGTNAVAFSSAIEPRQVAAGGCRGNIWCSDLRRLPSVTGISWTHRLDGPVTFIQAYRSENIEYFLLGSLLGELCLLRAEDGHRVWQISLPSAALYATVKDDKAWVMVRGAGMVSLGRISAEQIPDLDSIVKSFAELNPETEPVWTWRISSGGIGIYSLLKLQKSPTEVLNSLHEPEGRATLIRFLLAQNQIDSNVLEYLTKHASYEELVALLDVLGTNAQGLFEKIQTRLHKEYSSQGNAIKLDNTNKNTATAVLRYLDHQQPNPDNILNSIPPVFFKSARVQWELARVLLESVERLYPGKPLLPYLTPYLARLPTTVVGYCLGFIKAESETAIKLRSVLQFLEASAQTKQTLAYALAKLTRSFKEIESPNAIHRLLAYWFGLHHGYIKLNTDEAWAGQRKPILQDLSGLIHIVNNPTDLDIPFAQLASALSIILPKALLNETETRDVAIAWVDNAQRRLGAIINQHALEDEYKEWAKHIIQALDKTREVLWQVLRQEARYWQELVRPRLLKPEIRRDENDFMNITFRVSPEEDITRLRDVTILFRSPSLRPPGEVEVKRNYLQYPSQVREETVELSGFLAKGLTELEIKVVLRAGNGYRNETLWRFPLPKPSSLEEKSALPIIWGDIYAEFRDKVFRAEEGILVIAIDPGLGRNQLLADWDVRHPGSRLNLDERLREIGPNKTYGAQRLDAELLQGEIQEAVKALLIQREDRQAIRLFIGPMDDTLERLFVAAESETIRVWLSRLLAQSKANKYLRFRLVLSSRHACRLRSLGLAGLAELAFHRLTISANRWDSSLMNWIETKTPIAGPNALIRFEELGRDFRLLAVWLNASQKPRKPLEVQEFLKLPEPRSYLEAELHSLNVFELSVVIVGALAQCQVLRQQVVPGQYAGKDYFSSIQVHAAKLLQKQQQSFSQENLARLNADANPPSHLLLQGISLTAPNEVESTALLYLLTAHRAELEAACKRLAELGLGKFIGGVFRTGAPYREWITGFYAQFEGLPAHVRDTRVFPLLAEAGREPVELLQPVDVLYGGASLDQLLAASSPEELAQLRRLASAWSTHGSVDSIEPVFRKIFAEETHKLLKKEGRWDAPLFACGITGFGLGRIEWKDKQRQVIDSEPATYVVWLAGVHRFDALAFYKAVDESLRQRPLWLKEKGLDLDSPLPRFILTGPGVEDLPEDPERRVALLSFADYARAAWHGRLAEGLWQRARALSRLTAFSPFRSSGALPSGSRLFVGRDEEQEFILSRLPKKSILIVGCRRVGKTSLLNQVLHRLRYETSLLPVFLDLQGVQDREGFWIALLAKLDTDKSFESIRKFIQKKKLKGKEEVRLGLYHLAEMARKQGRTLALLLNEIDAIARYDADLLNIFRGLNDQGSVRFLFVGYTVIGQLGAPNSPFFHFTEGTHYGDKAISLAELKPSAAEKLLDLLEQAPLQLNWRNHEEKTAAYQLLLERSYRIPWVLQRYGHLLVERMEKEQRGELCLEDVNQMLHEEGRVVWQYISQIEYDSLGFETSKLSIRKGFQIILYTLARKFYFLGGANAPIRDSRLNKRIALDLGFNVGDILVTVEETVRGLLSNDEWGRFQHWFNHLKPTLNRDLKLLTLTLILEPDPIDPERYAFLLHIFPLELYREHGVKDPELDDLIIKTVAEFFDLLGHEE